MDEKPNVCGTLLFAMEGMEVDDLHSAYVCLRKAQQNPPDRVAWLLDALMNASNASYCICEHIIHLHHMRIVRQRQEFLTFLEWFGEIFDTITASSSILAEVSRSKALKTELPKLVCLANLFAIPTWIYFITAAHRKHPIPSARVGAFCNIVACLLRLAWIRKKNKRLTTI